MIRLQFLIRNDAGYKIDFEYVSTKGEFGGGMGKAKWWRFCGFVGFSRDDEKSVEEFYKR